MKNLLTGITTIFIGLATVVLVSVIAIGPERTWRSLHLVSARLVSDISAPPEKQFATSNLTSLEDKSVLGNSAEDYSDLNIVDVKPVGFKTIPAPFLVPTTGIAAHKNFLYNPIVHGGVDIWTNVNGKGLETGSSKGYPVYSACDGVVTRVYHPNQEIEVVCNEIDQRYRDLVPSLKVKVLYAHMGDAVNKEQYHSLRPGQILKKGDLIGYQGNVSSITPVNRVTHLHFGVYDLTKSNRPTLNPDKYIGVPATVVGQIFKSK